MMFALSGALAVLALLAAAGWWQARAARQRAAASAVRVAELEAAQAAHEQTEAALRRARDAAEAANIAKSRYLVSVSHEIRSPLNAIYGFAQLLERGGSVPPDEAGAVIRRSSEHLTNIVEGLLDISHIESGVLKLNHDIVPLPAFLETIVAMFRVEAANKGLAFHYRPAANLPAVVRTDEKRLRQILINLLSNAIKYTPAGEASLTVRYKGLVAEFTVADTGIGIPPEDIDRIFEPFERGQGEVTQAQPGTGLGLAITRVLARVMGGDLAVSSTPGEGSVFKLRLLLAQPGEAVATSARQRLITGYAGRRRHILIIDDDPSQLAVLQGLLRPLGFEVATAANGPDGIAAALGDPPDLVLLDIQMPDMSGWAVAKRLRAVLPPRDGRPLQILMVSANAHEFAAGGDGAAAHDGFIVKPVALEPLLDAIAARLGLTWQEEGEAEAASPPLASLPDGDVRLAELRRLGQAGHLRGIEAALTALADEVPASAPLVAQLRSRVRAFDLGGYLRDLDSHG
jgi:signal transduction histidine kinase/DNA-binding response OmpR family regulator